MYAGVSFYISRLEILKTEYMDCREMRTPEEKSLELGRILTQLQAINKHDCPENKKVSFAFEIEEFQLHILYMAISKKLLLEGHEVSSEELLARYSKLTNSSVYQELKPWDAKKQKIDRYISNLKSGLIQDRQLSVSR